MPARSHSSLSRRTPRLTSASLATSATWPAAGTSSGSAARSSTAASSPTRAASAGPACCWPGRALALPMLKLAPGWVSTCWRWTVEETTDLLAAVLADLEPVVGGITSEQLHDPTPCADYPTTVSGTDGSGGLRRERRLPARRRRGA